MRLLCTTVKRGAEDYHISGRILEIEIPSGEIVASLNLPDKCKVSGPRGGSRGGRGVRVLDDRIYVAIYDRILVYNFAWELISEISHPHVVGHHEIQVDAEGIWCCSTIVDAIFKIDFQGRVLFEWWASEDDRFISWLNARKIHWDKTVVYAAYQLPDNNEAHPDKQFHFNSIYNYRGRIYVHDSNHQALFTIWPGFKPVFINPDWENAHNVCPRSKTVLVNNSAKKSFEVWSLPNRKWGLIKTKPRLLKRIKIFQGEERSTQFSKSGWIRGLVPLDYRSFIVGSNPASLYLIKDWSVQRHWRISNDVNESIHGLTIKPGPISSASCDYKKAVNTRR